MTRPFDQLFRWLAIRLRPIGACGQAGLIVGMLVGGLLGIHDLVESDLALTANDALAAWLVLGLLGWLVLLAIFVVFVRWALATVIVPTFVNAALVSGLTILIAYMTKLYALGFFIGILVGLIVGALLCWTGRWLRGAGRDGLY